MHTQQQERGAERPSHACSASNRTTVNVPSTEGALVVPRGVAERPRVRVRQHVHARGAFVDGVHDVVAVVAVNPIVRSSAHDCYVGISIIVKVIQVGGRVMLAITAPVRLHATRCADKEGQPTAQDTDVDNDTDTRHRHKTQDTAIGVSRLQCMTMGWTSLLLPRR